MDWQDTAIRVSALRLMDTGVITENKSNASLVEHLLTLSWIKRSIRAGEVHLIESSRTKFQEMLVHTWPEWENTLAFLKANELSIEEKNLARIGREDILDQLIWPNQVHFKTAAAITGQHSKSSVDFACIPESTVLTHDDAIRVRLHEGAVIRHPDHEDIPGDNAMKILGEISFSERSLIAGAELCGILPRAAMTVENLGAFVDLPKPDSLLLLHTPGWNISLVKQLLDFFPADLPWLHFGDLDADGAAIYEKLHAIRQDNPPKWFIPEWWVDYRRGWDLSADSGLWSSIYAPRWVKELGESGRWLEQEAILLDPRFQATLNDTF